jgi:chromosome partitioning protein
VAGDVENFLAQGRGERTPWSDARLYAARIRRNIRLAEAPSFGQPILDYAPESHGAEDYLALAQELLAAHGVAAPAPASDVQVPRRRRAA